MPMATLKPEIDTKSDKTHIPDHSEGNGEPPPKPTANLAERTLRFPMAWDESRTTGLPQSVPTSISLMQHAKRSARPVNAAADG